MDFKQAAKSKTLNFNVFMPIILTVLSYFDVKITPELTAAIFALGNILLRFVTTKALKDK